MIESVKKHFTDIMLSSSLSLGRTVGETKLKGCLTRDIRRKYHVTLVLYAKKVNFQINTSIVSLYWDPVASIVLKDET